VGIGHYIRYGWAREIKAIAIIPDFEVPTAKARDALPKQYSSKDLVCFQVIYINVDIQFTTIGCVNHGINTIAT
jgi:homoserine kinase